MEFANVFGSIGAEKHAYGHTIGETANCRAYKGTYHECDELHRN